jgi:uncharacterized protein (TIGR02611 family)
LALNNGVIVTETHHLVHSGVDASMKRYAKIVVGFTLLLVGTALLVLPGPGLLVIALGLALLAAEFAWAANLLGRIKQQVEKLRQKKSPPGRPDTPAP